MNTDNQATSVTQTEREIRIERVFEAPRALVWEAFTSLDHLSRWWGPSGFSTRTERLDVRAGGQWRYVMIGPDGHEYPNQINYIKVEPPSRLVYKHGGDTGLEPVNFSVQITFEEQGADRTLVRMRMEFPSNQAKEFVIREYGALDGGRQTMQSLADHLHDVRSEDKHGGTALVIRRVFDAPVGLVWSAWTSADHLLHWFHPESWVLSTSEMDLRGGGSFHYCMSADGAPDMWGLWRFRKIIEGSSLEFVVSFSDPERNIVRAPFDERWPLETLTRVIFEPHAGVGRGTLLTMRAEPINASDEERATFVRGFDSMNQGWGQTLDSLACFLKDVGQGAPRTSAG